MTTLASTVLSDAALCEQDPRASAALPDAVCVVCDKPAAWLIVNENLCTPDAAWVLRQAGAQR